MAKNKRGGTRDVRENRRLEAELRAREAREDARATRPPAATEDWLVIDDPTPQWWRADSIRRAMTLDQNGEVNFNAWFRGLVPAGWRQAAYSAIQSIERQFIGRPFHSHRMIMLAAGIEAELRRRYSAEELNAEYPDTAIQVDPDNPAASFSGIHRSVCHYHPSRNPHPDCRCLIHRHTWSWANPGCRWYHWDDQRSESHEILVKKRTKEAFADVPFDEMTLERVKLHSSWLDWRDVHDAAQTVTLFPCSKINCTGARSSEGVDERPLLQTVRRRDLWWGWPRPTELYDGSLTDWENHELARQWDRTLHHVTTAACGRALTRHEAIPVSMHEGYYPQSSSLGWHERGGHGVVTFDVLGANLGVAGLLSWAIRDAVSQRAADSSRKVDYREAALVMLDQWPDLPRETPIAESVIRQWCTDHLDTVMLRGGGSGRFA